MEGVSVLAEKWHEAFMNEKRGFRSLLSWAEGLRKEFAVEDLLFCGENTGNYSRKAADYIYGKNYDLWLANPLEVKRNNPLQRNKTDRADARMIAEYAMRRYDKCQLYRSPSKALSNLRELYAYRVRLVNQRKEETVRTGEKLYTMEKCEAMTFIRQESKKLVNRYTAAIRKCEEKIKEVLESEEELRETYEILTSMPGVGLQTAVCLIVYTENFSKFEYDARRLACFFGVAPFGKESGTSVKVSPHVSRYCCTSIKASLHEPALCAVRFEPNMRAYYQRLIAKGKPHLLALNNVKSKMLHILMAMMRNRQMYDPAYRSPLSTCA